MRPNDESTSQKSTPDQSDAYTEAKRNWESLTNHEEAGITIRSLSVTIRLAMPHAASDSEKSDIQWLLWMVEYLADIVTYAEA